MSTTDLKCAEVPVEENRNCWLGSADSWFSSEQRSKAFFSLCYFALFPVCAGLQGRLLSHSSHSELLVPQLMIPGASQCQGNVSYSLACAEFFFYIYIFLKYFFKLAARICG